MFCNNCGQQIIDDSRFCEYCGTNLAASNPSVVYRPSSANLNVQRNENTCEAVNTRQISNSNYIPDVQNGRQDSQGQTIIVNQVERKSNGTGTAGFVLAIIAIFLGWVPVLGWILWFLGLILSFAGIFKQPRGLAITGLIISLIDLILLIVVFGAIAGIVGSLLSGL